MTALRVGLVGCGRVGVLHLEAIARAAGVEAIAVSDVDVARADEVAARFGVARVLPDIDALVASDVDVVAVCVPPRDHFAVAGAALAAGRHVLVEKPLTLDPDEAADLVAAVPEGVVACTGFNLRTHRQVAAARRLLAQGALGRLSMIRTQWTSAPAPPGWRSAPDQGGDPLWAMGIHHLDLWRHLTGGEPGEVRAAGDRDALAVSARTPDGMLLTTTLAAGTSDSNEVELVGERGRLTLTLYRADGPRWAPIGQAAGGPGARLRGALRSARTLPAQARIARGGGDFLLSFAAEWEAMRDAVLHDAPPHATLADGRAAVALAAAAQAALHEDRSVEVPE
jgi:predicted dehydrogenase